MMISSARDGRRPKDRCGTTPGSRFALLIFGPEHQQGTARCLKCSSATTDWRNSMRRLSYVLAAVATFAVAVPTLASAQDYYRDRDWYRERDYDRDRDRPHYRDRDDYRDS